MLGTPPAAPPGFGFQQQAGQLLDATPYNRAVDTGNRFINTIPRSANSLFNSSPLFKSMSPGLRSGLNTQAQLQGGDMRNQAGLEFARKAGSEVPPMMLQQQTMLRGLENEWGDLLNDLYRNQVSGATGSVEAMMRLLGALTGFI